MIKMCTKCRVLKDNVKDFYKIHHGQHAMSECKDCCKSRARKDYRKRGLEHTREIKYKWLENHGGKAYNNVVAMRFRKRHPELVRQRARNCYYKAKKECKQCREIRPGYSFKENPDICIMCLRYLNEVLAKSISGKC